MAVVPDLSGTRDQFHRRQYFHAGRRGGRIDLGSFMHIRIHCALYLSVAVLGLCCCAPAFSSCGQCGPLFMGARGLLIAVASPVAEHRF